MLFETNKISRGLLYLDKFLDKIGQASSIKVDVGLKTKRGKIKNK